MSESFAEHINIVEPKNSCDVCGKPAGFYSTLFYIHICSEECFNKFMNNINEELNRIAPIVKLNPNKLNGEKK